MPLRRLRFPPFASVSLFDPRAVSSSRPAARPGRRAQASSRLGVAVAGPRVPAFPAHALTTVSTASNYAWSGRPRSPRPRRCNAQAAAGRERRPAYHRGTHGPEHSPSVVRARRRLRKLERATFVGNRVVARHDPVLLHAKNISKSLRIAHLHKPAFLRDLWRPREQLVVHRKVDLANVAIRGVNFGDVEQPQFLRQSPLQGAKRAFAAPARLRRIGGNMLDPKLGKSPSHLR